MAYRSLVRSFRVMRCVSNPSAAVVQSHTTPRILCSSHKTLFARVSTPSCFHSSTQLQNANIVNIQDTDDFTEKVLQSSTPVIVDFHASWCGPCKILGPRLESMVADQNGKVILAKIDIDENSDLAIDHGVEAVPTVLGIVKGKVVDKFVGNKDDADLTTFIRKITGE